VPLFIERFELVWRWQRQYFGGSERQGAVTVAGRFLAWRVLVGLIESTQMASLTMPRTSDRKSSDSGVA
jgi:hypothetical protein